MNPHPNPSRGACVQSGSFLLEALIAILIVALGVLGSVGLLARSMQETDDARNRAEAAALANGLIADMWMTDRVTSTLQTEYNSVPGTGSGYVAFKTLVEARLPNTGALPPIVEVVPGPATLPTSSMVTITIRWRPPSDLSTAPPHKVDITAAIGANT